MYYVYIECSDKDEPEDVIRFDGLSQDEAVEEARKYKNEHTNVFVCDRDAEIIVEITNPDEGDDDDGRAN